MDAAHGQGDTEPDDDMDRTMWISLMALGLGLAVLLTGRAFIDGVDYLHAVDLAAEVESLDGAPSSQDLAERVTEAAGCIYGNRPPVRTCWYAWARPENPRFLAIIAARVQADAGGSALGHLFASLPFWALALVSAWKASRPSRPLRPSLSVPPSHRLDPPPPHGRMVR